MSDKITAIYCRISTSQQKLDSQEDELNKWIELHHPTMVKWYKDKFTGKSMDRPSMRNLLDDLCNSRLKEIVIYRLDRLGRTASGLTKLFDQLQRYKCNLISLRDHLDLSTPSGRLNANIIASVASYETEVRAERVRSGQISAKARGKIWGGSKKIRKKKTEAKVKSVLALLDNGLSKAEIARTVGISIPTIYSILRKP
jgi:DNA invertase Pin-like site-specific DNA recombinase